MSKRKLKRASFCFVPLIAAIAMAVTSLWIFQAWQPAQAQAEPTCTGGVQESGALYQICVPDNWNGTLMLWSHGYVAPSEPLTINNSIGGVSLPATYAQFGYAFATTSFSKNGLAIREGVADIVDLVSLFTTEHSTPTRTILQSASMGSLIATLAIEENPDVFDGGLALCGPYGDFQAQIDYFTDGRVLFDHFFPDVLPPSPVDVPQELIASWGTVLTTTVIPNLANPANIAQVQQLLSTASIPFDTQIPTTSIEAISGLLWFNVQGANDGVATLGGSAYGNIDKVYAGSLDDAALNENIARFSADEAALNEVEIRYQTTGQLQVPLLTMHTTLDPVVPYQQAVLYQAKVDAAGRSAFYQHQSFDRYGHCQFETLELLGGLTALNTMIDAVEATAGTQMIFIPVITSATD